MSNRYPVTSVAEIFAGRVTAGQYVIGELRVDVRYENNAGSTGANLMFGMAGVGGIAARERRHVPIGHYVRVWLPEPLKLDLLLRSRSQPDPHAEGLAMHFDFSATSTSLVEKQLVGPLREALITYSGSHVIEMRDDYVEFGPYTKKDGAPAAADLEVIGATVETFDPTWFSTTEAEAYEGDDAEFCYFCGFNVRPGTAQCPQCESDLRDDDDE